MTSNMKRPATGQGDGPIDLLSRRDQSEANSTGNVFQRSPLVASWPPDLTLAEKRIRDKMAVASSVERAKRSPWMARQWAREYAESAARLEPYFAEVPLLEGFAANLQARASGILQAVSP